MPLVSGNFQNPFHLVTDKTLLVGLRVHHRRHRHDRHRIRVVGHQFVVPFHLDAAAIDALDARKRIMLPNLPGVHYIRQVGAAEKVFLLGFNGHRHMLDGLVAPAGSLVRGEVEAAGVIIMACGPERILVRNRYDGGITVPDDRVETLMFLIYFHIFFRFCTGTQLVS